MSENMYVCGSVYVYISSLFDWEYVISISHCLTLYVYVHMGVCVHVCVSPSVCLLTVSL